MAHSPLLFTPLANSPLFPFLTPFYLLGTLLAVTGSVHLGLRLLVNWPPLSHPPPPNSQNPNSPAPHYDDLRTNPASSVRNKSSNMILLLCSTSAAKMLVLCSPVPYIEWWHDPVTLFHFSCKNVCFMFPGSIHRVVTWSCALFHFSCKNVCFLCSLVPYIE